jgi:hypothetical protein
MLVKLCRIHQEQMVSNTLKTNSDGFAEAVEVKIPLGQPTMNKVGGQKRMLASKKSSVKWY